MPIVRGNDYICWLSIIGWEALTEDPKGGKVHGDQRFSQAPIRHPQQGFSQDGKTESKKLGLNIDALDEFQCSKK